MTTRLIGPTAKQHDQYLYTLMLLKGYKVQQATRVMNLRCEESLSRNSIQFTTDLTTDMWERM